MKIRLKFTGVKFILTVTAKKRNNKKLLRSQLWKCREAKSQDWRGGTEGLNRGEIRTSKNIQCVNQKASVTESHHRRMRQWQVLYYISNHNWLTDPANLQGRLRWMSWAIPSGVTIQNVRISPHLVALVKISKDAPIETFWLIWLKLLLWRIADIYQY